MRRRSTRKQKGAGCGCGGMEMLGFPKTGGFLNLFGGQETAMGTSSDSTGQDSSVVMKKLEEAPQKKQSSMESRQAMPVDEAMPGEQAMAFSRPKPRKPSMSDGYSSEMDGEVAMMRPKRMSMSKRSMKSSLESEIRTMKQDIETLKNQVSELQYSSGNSTTTSRGLFGGRRKTLRRMRKHRR